MGAQDRFEDPSPTREGVSLLPQAQLVVCGYPGPPTTVVVRQRKMITGCTASRIVSVVKHGSERCLLLQLEMNDRLAIRMIFLQNTTLGLLA